MDVVPPASPETPTDPATPPDLAGLMERGGHQQVTVVRDPSVGYVGILAIHSTALGPAVGGTRVWRYASFDEALADALRLSRGMTFKNALAGLPFGGGKAVLLGPAPAEREEREAWFRAHGRAVDGLGGRFITAEDVGTSPSDMAAAALETRHVAWLERGMGDPSPYTARGVLRAMEASAVERWGSADLAGRRVAIQGLGNVGMHLARLLRERGARLIVADVVGERAEAARKELGADIVAPGAILAVEAEILAPCALGGILDRDTVDRLRVEVVCGGANNQLLRLEDGDRLAERGILYVPDYVANAGGVITGGVDIAGWDRDRMEAALEGIFDTTRRVVAAARESGVAPQRAADRLAEERLGAARPGENR
jgi:leucine dehydrogenase